LPLRGGDGLAPLDFVPAREETAGAETLDGALAIGRKLIIPLGLAISCIAHVMLLTPAAYFAGANPFDAAPPDAIAVDIVSPEEAGEAPKPESAAPDATPPSAPSPPGMRLDLRTTDTPSPAAPAEPSPQRPSQPSSPPATRAVQQNTSGRQAAAQARPAEPPLPAPEWMPQQFAAAMPDPTQPEEGAITNMFAMPLTLPDGKVGGKYDSQAVERANISNDSIAAFRSHLKTCSTLPAGRLAPEVKVVLRVYLQSDGLLAAGLPQNPEPIKVEGVTAGGGALYQSAVAAVRRCQPYTMLPPDRYEEWKSIDLTFTPQNF
jgi:hypothetical protein